MSVEIEQKVVEMNFDNAKFEDGVKDTLSTLKRLNESLKLKSAQKGSDNLNKALRSINLRPVDVAIQMVNKKVTVATAAMTATVMNLTNTVVNKTKSTLKAITFDPVKSGLTEYEEKMKSIQVIMSNTKRFGTKYADVANALDELNVYADKTIYNFQQMTSAIGQFTTQGVPLARSVAAVKGVANLAAYVGAPASDASRAMFQLSQALSTGTVRLQDWMSLEHTAGMGGKEFQTRLIETARVLNTGVDKALKKAGNFRESLKDQWLTTEVLTTTLAQFAGEVDRATLKQQGFNKEQIESIIQLGKEATESATLVKTISQLKDTMAETLQSGWAQSWEYIVGDLKSASSLLTGISKAFDTISGQNADARNQMLKLWNLGSGRDAVIEGIKYILKGLGPILVATGAAINEIFPPVTGKRMLKASETFYKFSKNAELSKKAFKGLINVLRIAVVPFKVVHKVVSVSANIFAAFLGTTARLIGSWLEAIGEIEKLENPFTAFIDAADKARGVEAVTKILDNLSLSTEKVVKNFKNFLGTIKYSKIVENNFKNIGLVSAAVYKFVVRLLEKIATFKPEQAIKGFQKVYENLKNILGIVKDAPMVSFFLDKLQNGGIKLFGIFQRLSSNLFKVGDAVAYFISTMIKNGPDKILDSWEDFNKRSGSLFLNNPIFGFIARLIATIPKMLAIGANMITTSPVGKAFGYLLELIVSPINAIRHIVETLVNSLATSFEKLNIGSITVMVFAATIIKAINAVTNAMDKIAGLASWLRGFISIFTGFFQVATKELKETAKTYRTSLKAKIILQFAAAIAILTASLAVLTALDMDKLKTSAVVLSGVVTVMTVAVMALANATNGKDVAAVGIGMSLMAASLSIAARAIMNIGKIDTGTALKSILVLGAIITAFTGVTLLVDKAIGTLNWRNVVSFSAFMIGFATMLVVVTKTMQGLDKLPFSNIVKSLTIFIGMVGMLKLAGMAMDRVRFGSAIGFSVLLITITKVLPALIKMGSSLPDLLNASKAAVFLAGILKILSLTIRGVGKDLMLAGAGIVGISLGISILTLAARSFGKLETSVFVKGLTAIGIATACFAALVALSNLTGGLGQSFHKVGLGLIGVAIATGVLSVAAQQFAKLDNKAIAKMGAIFGEIMILFSVLTIASSMATGKAKVISALTKNLMLLSISMAVLSLIDADALLASSTALTIAMIGLASVFAGAGQIADKKNIKAITMVGVMVAALTGVMIYISNMPNGSKFLSVATGMSEVLLALGITLRLLGSKELKIDKTLIGQLGLLSVIVLGLYALMSELNVNAKNTVNPSYIIAIGTILTIVSANIRILQGMKSLNKGLLKNVAALSGIMSGLFAVVSIFSNRKASTSTAIKNATAVSILLLTISQVIRSLQDAKALDADVLVDLGVLSSLAAALMGVTALMGEIFQNGSASTTIANAVAVGILLTTMSTSLLTLQNVKEVSKAALLGMGVLTGVVIGLSFALSQLSKIKPMQALANAASIGIILTTLTLAVVGISAVGKLTGPMGLLGLVSAGGMLGVVWGLSEIMKSLSGIDTVAALRIADSLSEVLLSLTAATILIQAANPVQALSGVVAMGILVAAMGGILSALGYLNDKYGMNSAVQSGGEVLKSIGEALGDFFGGFIGGIIGGAATTALPAIGTALSEFAHNASDFFDITTQVDADSMQGFYALTQALLTLTGSNALSGAVDWLSTVGKSVFGPIGLIVDKFGGKATTLSSFADELQDFGPKFADFANSVSGIQGLEQVNQIGPTLKTLIDAMNALPGVNGMWQTWAGDQSLQAFSTQLPLLATNLTTFVKKLPKEVDEDLVTKVANMTRAFAEIASGLPTINAARDELGQVKRSNLEQFGDTLEGYADSFVKFASKLKEGNIDTAIVGQVTSMSNSLVTLANAVPAIDGITSLFAGHLDIGVFGNQLTKFGEGIAGFYEKIGPIKDTTHMDLVVQSAKAISELATVAPKSGGMFNLLDSDFENFIQNLAEFGKGIADFYDESKNVSPQMIINIAEGLQAIVDVCKNVDGIDNESVGNFSASLGELAKANLSSFTTVFDNAGEAVRNTITKFASYVKSSLEVERPELEKEFKSLATVGINALESEYQKLMNSGKGLGAQLTSDLDDKKTEKSIGKKTIKMFNKSFTSLNESFKKLSTKIKNMTKVLSSMAPSLEKVSEALSKTDKKAKNTSSSVKDVGTKSKKAGKKIEEAAKGTSKGSKAMSDLASSTKKAGKATQDQTGKQKKAKTQTDKLKKSTKELGKQEETTKKPTEEASTTLDKLGEAADKAKGGISGLISSITGGDIDLGGVGLGDTLQRIGSYFTEFDPKDVEVNFNPKDIEKSTKKSTDKIVKDLNKNLNTNTKTKTKNVVKEFKDDLSKTLQGVVSPFEEFSKKPKKSIQTMIGNLNAQYAEISKWSRNINKLAKSNSGINKGLLKTLVDMGPTGSAYVSEIVKASAKTRKKLNAAYIKTMSLTNSATNKIVKKFGKAGLKAAVAFQNGTAKGMSRSSKRIVKQALTLAKTYTYAYQKSYLSEQKKSEAKTNSANDKMLEKRLNSGKKLTKNQKKIMEDYQKYTLDGVTVVEKKLSVGQGAVDAFVSSYIKKASDVKSFGKAVNYGSKAVTAYTEKLYKNSEYYKEDKKNYDKNAKAYEKSLKKQQKAEKNYQKLVKKYKKNRTQENLDRVLEAKETLKLQVETTKKSRKELEKSQKEMAKNTKQVYKELRESIKNDIDSFLSVTDIDFDLGIDLFADFDKSKISSTKVLNNITKQLGGVESWMTDMGSLEAKGLSDGLQRYIEDLGPVTGRMYAHAFATMTEEQIAKANELWEKNEKLRTENLTKKYQQKADQAVEWSKGLQQMAVMGFSQSLIEQLGAAGISSYDEVMAFLNMDEKQVKEFNKSFKNSLSIPDTVADEVIASYAYAGSASKKAFVSAINKVNPNLKIFSKISSSAKTTINTGLKTAANSGISNLTTTLTSKSNKQKVTDAGTKTGGYVGDGMADGISSKANVVKEAAQQVAKGALSAAAKTLDIHSPSREFQRLGALSDEGAAIGFKENASIVDKEVVNVMQSALENAKKTLEEGTDDGMVITPIIDLTNIQNGVKEIDRTINGQTFGTTLRADQVLTTDLATQKMLSGGILKGLSDLKTALGTLDTGETKIENVFHINSTNPKETANEISRILQKQVDRRKAVWA